MKDLLIGLSTIALTCAIGALTLWAIWHYAVILAPFVRALNSAL